MADYGEIEHQHPPATAELHLPHIGFNPDSWGPTELLCLDTEFPYQPYSKSELIGKIADFTGSVINERQRNKYTSLYAGTKYTYTHEDDESTFQTVDTKTQKYNLPRQRMARPNLQLQARLRLDRERRRMNAFGLPGAQQSGSRNPHQQRQQLRKVQGSNVAGGGRGANATGGMMGRSATGQQAGGRSTIREASIQVKDSFIVKEELDFVRLNKLYMEPPSDAKDLICAGEMEFYDKKYDRVSVQKAVPLQRINRLCHSVNSSSDILMFELMNKKEGDVFLTDSIMSALMCCTRSVFPWDVVVSRFKEITVLDKREKSEFDFLTVNETATNPPNEESNHINSARNLSLEATFINKNFSQQVLKTGEEKFGFERPYPFGDEDDENCELASIGFRYRRFTLPNGTRIVVRCEQDAVMMGPNQETQFINIKALNEWDSRACNGVDWRSKLDSQRGAVLAAELKNNAFKLAKWTCCALLAGSDQIKFGYVSRVNPMDSNRHEILGTQQFKPIELANQINLDMAKAWGIFRCIIDMCVKLPEGTYLIMKDPNKSALRLYSIPKDALDTEDEGEEEEETEKDALEEQS